MRWESHDIIALPLLLLVVFKSFVYITTYTADLCSFYYTLIEQNLLKY